LNDAVGKVLEGDIAPSRDAKKGIDNRGTHVYLARYWAEAMAAQNEDLKLKERFAVLAKQLAEKQDTILAEINTARGCQLDIGGYYRPEDKKVAKAMRPSATMNKILADFVGQASLAASA
jgi:isocitrate dehydrogenase